MVDWVCLGAETARRGPRRATVGRPHGPAIPVDGHAVGPAPRPSLDGELRPIADDAIRIGAAVDRRNVLGLGLASFHGHPHDDRRSKSTSRESRHRSAPSYEKLALFFNQRVDHAPRASGTIKVTTARTKVHRVPAQLSSDTWPQVWRPL